MLFDEGKNNNKYGARRWHYDTKMEINIYSVLVDEKSEKFLHVQPPSLFVPIFIVKLLLNTYIHIYIVRIFYYKHKDVTNIH